jgi:AAHS family benzoate transporter-like MFS transporter
MPIRWENSVAVKNAAPARVARTPVAVTLLSLGALAFEGFDLYSYGAAIPFLLKRADWGLTPRFAGLIGSMLVVGMLVGALFAGAFTDYLGRRAVYLMTVSCFSIGAALSAVAGNPEWLMVGRILLGLGAGGFNPVAFAMVTEYSRRGRGAFNMVLASICLGGGGAVAAAVAIWVTPRWGYPPLFWIGALPLVLIVPFALVKLPESVSLLVAKGRIEQARAEISRYHLNVELPTEVAVSEPRQDSPLTSLRLLFTRRHARPTVVMWVANAMVGLLLFASTTWLPTLMTKAGYGISSALAFMVVFQVGAVSVSLASTQVAKRHGLKSVVLFSLGCSLVGLVLLGTKPPVAVVYPLVALLGAGAGGALNLVNAYVSTYYPSAIRGGGLGYATAAGRLGGIVGPILGGTLVASHVSTAQTFQIFAGAPLVALIAVAFGPRVSIPAPEPEVPLSSTA